MLNFVQSKGQGVLNVCSCGRLHFTYGPVTLHFEREEFAKFAVEVGRLAVMIEHLPIDQEAVSSFSQGPSACH